MDTGTGSYLRALDIIVGVAAIASLVMLMIIIRRVDNEPTDDDE